MNNRFILILAACVVGFFGILFFTKKDSNKSNNNGGGQSSQLTQHTTGAGKTGVVLIEYGDFECPACYRFFPVIEQIKEKYKDQITFQFRHYPLVEIHKNALISARAAEAAGKQGKFFEMYSKLYTNQQTWTPAPDPSNYFQAYAKELGLDEAKFKTDMQSEEVNKIVQADKNYAKEQGFNSTPTFVLDGKKLENTQDTVEYFSQQIDQAIAAKNKSGQ